MKPVLMFAVITESAEAMNRERAKLAYVGATPNCVECHKFVRSVQVGQMR
jgi:hypothetical protein